MPPNLESIFFFVQSNPVILMLFSLYNVVLNGLSLWKAAKKSQKYWFIGLLVINFFGIPEILYLLYFSKIDNKKELTPKIEKTLKTKKQ